jgi:hypothetical protein
LPRVKLTKILNPRIAGYPNEAQTDINGFGKMIEFRLRLRTLVWTLNWPELESRVTTERHAVLTVSKMHPWSGMSMFGKVY